MSRLVQLGNTNICVSELKLKYVEHLRAICSDFDFIKKVILFGSVLDERCTIRSDIDFIIVGSKPKSKCLDTPKFREFEKLLFEFDFSQDYDIIYTNDIEKFSQDFKRNVKERVVLYEK